MFADINAIQKEGFEGFRTIKSLRESKLSEVPKEQGVYLVVWYSTSSPVFLSRSTGGHFKGKDPTVAVNTLQECWITTSPVVYIGKAGGQESDSTLQSRLHLYLRFGAGSACGHWGGRYIWQLTGSESLIVCWKKTPDEEPREVEKELIQEFKRVHGKYPYANCVG